MDTLRFHEPVGASPGLFISRSALAPGFPGIPKKPDASAFRLICKVSSGWVKRVIANELMLGASARRFTESQTKHRTARAVPLPK